MNIGLPLVTHPQAAELVQPAQGPLYQPAVDSQATAMLLTTLAQQRQDAATSQFLTQWVRVIASVSLHLLGASPGPTSLAFDGLDGIHQGKSLGYIMAVGPSKLYRQGDALSLSDNVVFAPSFSSVSRVGSRLLPPKTARTEALSSTARRQSKRPASCSRSRQVRWMASQTPRRCQSLSLRQQVMPLPQSIAWGNSSQGMPVFSTNRMPVRAWRSGIRGLPPLGLAGAGGSSGWTNSHSSSDTNGFAKVVTSFSSYYQLNLYL
jgi:hypothetical protein